MEPLPQKCPVLSEYSPNFCILDCGGRGGRAGQHSDISDEAGQLAAGDPGPEHGQEAQRQGAERLRGHREAHQVLLLPCAQDDPGQRT